MIGIGTGRYKPSGLRDWEKLLVGITGFKNPIRDPHINYRTSHHSAFNSLLRELHIMFHFFQLNLLTSWVDIYIGHEDHYIKVLEIWRLIIPREILNKWNRKKKKILKTFENLTLLEIITQITYDFLKESLK